MPRRKEKLVDTLRTDTCVDNRTRYDGKVKDQGWRSARNYHVLVSKATCQAPRYTYVSGRTNIHWTVKEVLACNTGCITFWFANAKARTTEFQTPKSGNNKAQRRPKSGDETWSGGYGSSSSRTAPAIDGSKRIRAVVVNGSRRLLAVVLNGRHKAGTKQFKSSVWNAGMWICSVYTVTTMETLATKQLVLRVLVQHAWSERMSKSEQRNS